MNLNRVFVKPDIRLFANWNINPILSSSSVNHTPDFRLANPYTQVVANSNNNPILFSSTVIHIILLLSSRILRLSTLY